MFNSYSWNNIDIGLARETASLFIFFGNRNFTKQHFTQVFPQYQFRLLKQIHSNTVVEASPNTAVADAHYSMRLNEALVIQTADCMPIMMANTGAVAACHAGWRGLAGHIVPLTARALGPVQQVFIGPHIGPQSFEVGVDVADELARSAPPGLEKNQFILVHRDPAKKYLDLAQLAQSQIRSEISPPPSIETLGLDTKTHLGFHSYRRDKENAERQYSFIVRTR